MIRPECQSHLDCDQCLWLLRVRSSTVVVGLRDATSRVHDQCVGGWTAAAAQCISESVISDGQSGSVTEREAGSYRLR